MQYEVHKGNILNDKRKSSVFVESSCKSRKLVSDSVRVFTCNRIARKLNFTLSRHQESIVRSWPFEKNPDGKVLITI